MKYRERQPYYRKPETKCLPERLTGINIQDVLSALKQLVHALDLAEPEEIEKHMKGVRKYLDISILQYIEDQVNNYEYDKALETLKGIMEEMEGRIE